MLPKIFSIWSHSQNVRNHCTPLRMPSEVKPPLSLEYKKVNKPHGQYYALRIYLDEYHLYLVCPIDNPCFILMSPLHLVFYISALLKFSKASSYTDFSWLFLELHGP